MEKLRIDDLWIPHSSNYHKNSQWIKNQGIKDEYKLGTHIMISTKYENDSLLNIKSFNFAIKIHEFVMNFTSSSGITFKNVCLRDPTAIRSSDVKEVKSILKEFPPYPKTCDMIEYYLGLLSESCSNLTPLLALTSSSDVDDAYSELHRFQGNDTMFLEYIRDLDISFCERELPEFKFIGGLKRNYNGRIKSATAMHFAYLFHEDENYDNETESLVGVHTYYQRELKDALTSEFSVLIEKENLEMMINFGSKQEIYNLLEDDVKYLLIGCLLVVLHLMASFSKCNLVEQRIVLAVAGLISCGLSVVSMLGICQFIGIPFNVLTNLVMIMLVGIGVDDMYVILQTIKAKTSKDSER